jgi:phosphatidylglycerophosphate synthase
MITPSWRNQSFLASSEQSLARAILAVMPESITPLQLTKIGVAGAVIAGVSLVGCRWSPLWLPLVALGISLNWFGSSLDGHLALRRNAAQPRLAFIEHASDLFSMTLIIVSFGISPFLSPKSAIIIMLCYLLFSAYTFIRAAVHHIRQMAYIGIGATEFRILMIVWAFAAYASGINETDVAGFSKLDEVVAILAIIAVFGLAIKAALDARRIAAEDNERAGNP